MSKIKNANREDMKQKAHQTAAPATREQGDLDGELTEQNLRLVE